MVEGFKLETVFSVSICCQHYPSSLGYSTMPGARLVQCRVIGTMPRVGRLFNFEYSARVFYCERFPDFGHFSLRYTQVLATRSKYDEGTGQLVSQKMTDWSLSLVGRRHDSTTDDSSRWTRVSPNTYVLPSQRPALLTFSYQGRMLYT